MKDLLNRASGATLCKEKTAVPFCPGILQYSGTSLTYQHRGCHLNGGITLKAIMGQVDLKEKRHIVGMATQDGEILQRAVVPV